ncbi:hypothetical protein QQ045_029769 [Rhodiola kirilowii]
MPKKMRLPPIFNLKNPPQHQPVDPKILAFQASSSPEKSSRSLSLSELAQDSGDEAEVLESVIRGVRSSNRLFFSPEKSNSILENTKDEDEDDHDHSACPNIINMESGDPYMDYRTSMEEMVEAHQLRDWDLLEDLLGCYLMVNEKRNHLYIIRAFVDLVISSSSFLGLSSSSSSSECCSPSDAVSDSFVTSSSSPLHFSSSSTTAGTSSTSSLAHVDKASHT